MLDDGMMDRFPKPDVILGQHLLQYRAGTVGYRSGQILTSGDSLLVRFFGKGAHGAMPQNGVDPVVMAASAVLRLQSIVSREVAPNASVVVTIGEFHAGTAENIIPAEAYIKLNVRTTDEAVRSHVLEAIKRICVAEAHASNAPKDPEFEPIKNYPLTVNDAEVTEKVSEAFRSYFGERAMEVEPAGASEDFSRFGRAWKVPYMFWFVGGTAPEKYDQAAREGTLEKLPGPHSPFWAPVLHPTLETGTVVFLLAGRIVQGLSAACIMPNTLGLVKTYWEGAERQRAVSFWSIGSWGGSGAAALGVAISAAVYTGLSSDVIALPYSFMVGRTDNVAVRMAAMAALLFNLAMVLIAIVSILATVPPGKQEETA